MVKVASIRINLDCVWPKFRYVHSYEHESCWCLLCHLVFESCEPCWNLNLLQFLVSYSVQLLKKKSCVNSELDQSREQEKSESLRIQLVLCSFTCRQYVYNVCSFHTAVSPQSSDITFTWVPSVALFLFKCDQSACVSFHREMYK
jgi:hypothetical protein